MSDWVEVTKKTKKTCQKNTQYSNISNVTKINNGTSEQLSAQKSKDKNQVSLRKNRQEQKKYNEKDLNLIFEDTYDDYINEEFYNLMKYLKHNSDILRDVCSGDIVDFFYDYLDVKSSVKITDENEEDKNDYYSDEEYY